MDPKTDLNVVEMGTSSCSCGKSNPVGRHFFNGKWVSQIFARIHINLCLIVLLEDFRFTNAASLRAAVCEQ